MPSSIRVRRLDTGKVETVAASEVRFWRPGYSTCRWWMTFAKPQVPGFSKPFIRSAPGSPWGVAVEYAPVLMIVRGGDALYRGERGEEART